MLENLDPANNLPFQSRTQPSSPDEARMVPVIFQLRRHTCDWWSLNCATNVVSNLVTPATPDALLGSFLRQKQSLTFYKMNCLRRQEINVYICISDLGSNRQHKSKCHEARIQTDRWVDVMCIAGVGAHPHEDRKNSSMTRKSPGKRWLRHYPRLFWENQVNIKSDVLITCITNINSRYISNWKGKWETNGKRLVQWKRTHFIT